ncbi:MAG TPA: acetate--CoA ligase family protein [archaeon]|nr:acetate--CoA ligase family protein [archaeon]
MVNLPESSVRTILSKYKIPIVKQIPTKTKEQAVKAAEWLGYPVVLKVISKSISHKTEVGAVVTGIKYKHEVEDAFDRIVKNVKMHRKSMQGVLVQKMGSGYEVIIGGNMDAQFGPTLMFGLGGVWVEALQDIAFRVCPLSRKDALEMIQEIKGYKILKGFRGKPAGDLESLTNTILKCSKMMMENKIQEFDINPLFVQPKGVIAVDFRMSK